MDEAKLSRVKVRRDSKHRATPTRTHEPKVDYDRRDRSWVDEQDAEYELEEQGGWTDDEREESLRLERERIKHDD